MKAKCNCDQYEDDEDKRTCSVCGYCSDCHSWGDAKDGCHSNLIKEKSDVFEWGSSDQEIYRCLKCGTDKFIVGKTDNYETAIKCPNCGFEKVVHDG